MKSSMLITGIICYILVFYYYRYYKVEIIEYVYSLTPRLYSTKNPNIITVDLSKFKDIKYSQEYDVLLSNNEYKYEPRIFAIDDTDELLNYKL